MKYYYNILYYVLCCDSFLQDIMARRLVTNLKDEYLSCSICLDQYRQPKTLPCDHIFCHECLINHVTRNIKTNKPQIEISCPVCREKTIVKSKGSFVVKSWVNALPTDSLVGSLMQTLNMHETYSRSPDVLPKLCEKHGGKPCDAYCFTHAQLMCWECAARDHRSCNVDSAGKAKHLVQPQIESMKKDLEIHLTRAREMSKSDETFKKTKSHVLKNLQHFERKLDNVFTSAKHQLSLLRTEVEHVTKMHLDDRKNFYEAVQSLLELKCSIEILSTEQDASKLFASLENIKREMETSVTKFLQIEKENESSGEHYVKFVGDDRLQEFLNGYSSVGFIDSNVPGSSSAIDSLNTPRSAPVSLSHIFKRSQSDGSPNVTD